MAGLTSTRPFTGRERLVFGIASIAYTLFVVQIGIHKGGDFRTHLVIADRLLDGLPLYPGPPPEGVWWPPFGILVVAPFAALARESLTAGKGAWAALLAGCVIWTVLRLRGRDWRPVALALLAVAVPVQGNFEHLNVGPLLLVCLVEAAVALEGKRDSRAGAWVGVAAALKAFPALLLLYFGIRGRWRALLVGGAVAAVVTILPTLPGGPQAVGDWVGIAAGGGDGAWLANAGNQSLAGLGARAGGGLGLWAALVAAPLAGVAFFCWRRRQDALTELGLAMLVIVLVSPIAWWHYYLLLLPLWAAVWSNGPVRGVRLWGFALAAALTSGLVTLGPYAWRRMLLEGSIYVWGALLLFGLVVLGRIAAPRASEART